MATQWHQIFNQTTANEKDPRNEINMDAEDDRANPNLTGSTLQSQLVAATSTESGNFAFDMVIDGFEHFNISNVV